MKSNLKSQLSLSPRTDLHTHTNCSDGALSPRQLVEKARDYELRYLAVTDHDTTAALAEARECAENTDLEIINGCELTCSEQGQEFHLLAYCFDESNKELQSHLMRTRNLRVDRCKSMLAKLDIMRIEVSFEDVQECAMGQSIVRPHIAAAMLKKGYVATTQEAFDRYLSNDGPAYVAIAEQPIHDVIPIIHAAGGVAVIAHPARSISTARIVELLNIGLDGIEAFHPSHNRQQIRYYRSMARRYNVVSTGGSDFHGFRFYDESNLGAFTVDEEVIVDMKARAARRLEDSTHHTPDSERQPQSAVFSEGKN